MELRGILEEKEEGGREGGGGGGVERVAYAAPGTLHLLIAVRDCSHETAFVKISKHPK